MNIYLRTKRWLRGSSYQINSRWGFDSEYNMGVARQSHDFGWAKSVWYLWNWLQILNFALHDDEQKLTIRQSDRFMQFRELEFSESNR